MKHKIKLNKLIQPDKLQRFMRMMMRRFFRLDNLILFPLIAAGIVFLFNFSPSTFLSGWDNLHAEFDLGLNIKRSIFSVWQSNQGLGVLAGNGHAADLPRQLLLLPLSFLPLHLIRQVYIFLTLALGPIGAYFLIKKLLSYKDKVINSLIPILGSLFYLFNLATIQTFYVPFEPFITHFAALPWLLLSALYFIAENNKKALLFFIIVNILAVPQGQVPTVFFVYLFSLSFFLLVLLIETRRRYVLKKCAQVIALTIIINAFWLLPFVYFLLTNSQVALNAKINQMATETVYSQNKEFGNLLDVMLLKGFWFNNVDLNLHNQFDYMLSPWREHLAPIISTIGYLFFSIIILGFALIKRRMPFVIPFSALFLLSFTMLTTNTPPFYWINEIFRKIPLFNEVFRFPFTKFSTLASLTYAFFFSVGIGKLMTIIKISRFKEKIKPSYIFVVSLVLFIIFIFPVFRGNLFYDRIKVAIPNEYFQLFDYLKTKDKTLRIANFPQHTFWGWNYYKWPARHPDYFGKVFAGGGYDGSGFLWYGIEQPILDRAFDVWSKNNENYYWEISHALYSKNPGLFENVLNKHAVSLLLLDGNIINPSSPKALFTDGLKKLISEIPSIQKDKSFGNLILYKVNLRNKTNEIRNTVRVNPYNWNDYDKAFVQYGNYISASKNANYFYPFRSLFSGKNEDNQEFNINVYQNKIEFSNPLLVKESANLLISDITKFVTAEFSVHNNSDNSITITSTIQTPEIFIESGNKRKKIWSKTINHDLFVFKKPTFPMVLNVNGLINFKIDKNQKEIIGRVLLLKDQNTILSLNDNKSKSLGTQVISTEFILSLMPPLSQEVLIDRINNNTNIIIAVPRIENGNQGVKILPAKGWEKDVIDCESFKKGQISGKIITENGKAVLKLISANSTACISYAFSTFDHNQGYIALVENANKEGRSIHFWFLNEDRKISIIDTYLKKNKNLNMSVFVIPPEERFSAGYSLHLDNQSIGKDKVVNIIGEISVLPIPYELLSSLQISDTKLPTNTILSILVNSQAFDPGWKAYQVDLKDQKSKIKNTLANLFPFFFGKELKEHVLVNNWANGWVIPDSSLILNNSSLVIIFWPQYLEYLGFALLIGTFAWLILARRRFKQQSFP